MSSGLISPGSFAQNATMPTPPTAVYSVMKMVAPDRARPSAPIRPPCWPPTDMPVRSWMAMEIQASSPDSANTCSPGCSVISRTGIVVPTIRCSTVASPALRVVDVVEEATPGRRAAAAGARALVAHADDEDGRPHRPKAVPLRQVLLELGHQPVLDVQHPLAHLADRVLVVLAGDLVVDGAVTQPHAVQGTRRGERLQRAVDGAAGEPGLRPLQLSGDLVRGAVTAQAADRVPH